MAFSKNRDMLCYFKEKETQQPRQDPTDETGRLFLVGEGRRKEGVWPLRGTILRS